MVSARGKDELCKRVAVKAKDYVVDGSKKGRPKKRWKEVVEKYMLPYFKKMDPQDGG